MDHPRQFLRTGPGTDATVGKKTGQPRDKKMCCWKHFLWANSSRFWELRYDPQKNARAQNDWIIIVMKLSGRGGTAKLDSLQLSMAGPSHTQIKKIQERWINICFKWGGFGRVGKVDNHFIMAGWSWVFPFRKTASLAGMISIPISSGTASSVALVGRQGSRITSSTWP